MVYCVSMEGIWFLKIVLPDRRIDFQQGKEKSSKKEV